MFCVNIFYNGINFCDGKVDVFPPAAITSLICNIHIQNSVCTF